MLARQMTCPGKLHHVPWDAMSAASTAALQRRWDVETRTKRRSGTSSCVAEGRVERPRRAAL